MSFKYSIYKKYKTQTTRLLNVVHINTLLFILKASSTKLWDQFKGFPRCLLHLKISVKLKFFHIFKENIAYHNRPIQAHFLLIQIINRLVQM